MKDDMISRQAAIDAVHKNYDVILDFTSNGQTISFSIEDILEGILSELPSAQPGWTTDVNNILAYLDGTVHPLVSPENWNVYSELYDMVSGLLKPWEGKQDGEG